MRPGFSRVGANFLGAVVVAILLPSVIYLPRAQLLSHIASGLKSGLAFLPMLRCLALIRWLLYDSAPE